ncbi:hypothetical protein M9H77_25183 [Catharanthus roseus]|uniref:Uncharacterized protein n=1 Tax=Catharanthus roseus TaxID=4058 RepID=A0ACC0A807_CATRO|nr:hypothetical protein M9H77_25183 [Catharanthus roseus]
MEEKTKSRKINLCSSPEVKKEDENVDDEGKFDHLPQVKTQHGIVLAKYKGFWFNSNLFQSLMSLHKHFEAKDTDIFLATFPKSGTTWLKALVHTIINRPPSPLPENHSGEEIIQSPLLFSNPHQLVPFLENIRFEGGENYYSDDVNRIQIGSRIFSSHMPYQCLPDSILQSNSKIIYLYRNPMDVFASTFAFVLENGFAKLTSVEEEFQLFSNGNQSYGPFWDHILGYWNQSLKAHETDKKRVLFLRYEDLKKDPNPGLKKMAEFLGFPFSVKEEESGMIERIANLCSFENLKNLEVNRKGETETLRFKVKNSSFFRKGEVGDWKNYLTPSMAESFEKLMEEKFAGSGFAMEMH